jgi:hypothetical protein
VGVAGSGCPIRDRSVVGVTETHRAGDALAISLNSGFIAESIVPRVDVASIALLVTTELAAFTGISLVAACGNSTRPQLKIIYCGE